MDFGNCLDQENVEEVRLFDFGGQVIEGDRWPLLPYTFLPSLPWPLHAPWEPWAACKPFDYLQAHVLERSCEWATWRKREMLEEPQLA